ncbi:MAG: reverse transcriptase/maturase family protein [archaeon]
MKTYDNLYEDIISLPNLYKAYFRAKKGKKNLKFQRFDKNLNENLWKLHEDLANKTYESSGYTVFYVKDYKKRKILAPSFRDHVLHHAIYNYLEEIYEQTFIFDSFACRKGKGTHFGLKRLKHFINKHSENDYFIKCDISKYFYSIDHLKLKEIFAKKIKDKELLWLLGKIIDSHFEENIPAHIFNPFTLNQEKGIPIGNLISQLFANIYLNELDSFVKCQLDIKDYVRYVDDFVILEKDKSKVGKIISELKSFLENELYLKLEDKKIQVNKISFGVDFIGYVIFKRFTRVRTRNYRRFKNKLDEKFSQFWKNEISFEEIKCSLSSYFAHLSYTNSEKIKKRIVAVFLSRAVERGGGWDSGANAGPFCAYLYDAPTNTYYGIGFRCCSGFLFWAGFLRKSCKLEMQLQPQSTCVENRRENLPLEGEIFPMNLDKKEEGEIK